MKNTAKNLVGSFLLVAGLSTNSFATETQNDLVGIYPEALRNLLETALSSPEFLQTQQTAFQKKPDFVFNQGGTIMTANRRPVAYMSLYNPEKNFIRVHVSGMMMDVPASVILAIAHEQKHLQHENAGLLNFAHYPEHQAKVLMALTEADAEASAAIVGMQLAGIQGHPGLMQDRMSVFPAYRLVYEPLIAEFNEHGYDPNKISQYRRIAFEGYLQNSEELDAYWTGVTQSRMRSAETDPADRKNFDHHNILAMFDALIVAGEGYRQAPTPETELRLAYTYQPEWRQLPQNVRFVNVSFTPSDLNPDLN